jgi:hypothetical protein
MSAERPTTATALALVRASLANDAEGAGVILATVDREALTGLLVGLVEHLGEVHFGDRGRLDRWCWDELQRLSVQSA